MRIGLDLGHVERPRALVLEQRRKLVHVGARQLRRQATIGLLLHERLAEPHVDRAFDLAARQDRVDRAPDVVRDPDLRHAQPAGGAIDLDLDHGRRERVGRRRADAGALVVARRFRRTIAAVGAERADAAPRPGAPPRRSSTPTSGSALSNTRRSAKTSRSTGTLQLVGDGAGQEQRARARPPRWRRCPSSRSRARSSCRDRPGSRSVSPVTAADVERIDAEHLGDAGDQHVVRALPDLGRAAEGGHPAGAIELELHARVRQLVPVDRQARAAQVRAAGDAETAPVAEPAAPLLPARCLHHRLDAAHQARRGDAQPVGGERIARHGVVDAPLGRVDARAPCRSCRCAPRARSAAAACRARAWVRRAACW